MNRLITKSVATTGKSLSSTLGALLSRMVDFFAEASFLFPTRSLTAFAERAISFVSFVGEKFRSIV